MTASVWRKAMIGLVALGWGAFVLAAYSIVHKPFGPTQARALAQLALTLVGWALTLLLAHWLGRGFVRFFPDLPSRERITLQIGLGFGVLGLIMLAAGAVGGYWPLIAWVAAAASLFNLRPFLADLTHLIPRWPDSRANRALALFVGFTLVLAFAYSLAPPIAWDSLVYHLTGPKLYLQAHRLHHDIDLPYLGFPQWGSMLFTWGMLLAGPALAHLIQFTFMILTLALVPAVVNRVARGRAWLATAILAGVPTAAWLASWAYVEWMTMFAGLAAFACLTAHGDGLPRGGGPVALAGALAGLALGAKYTAAGLAIGLCAVAVFQLRSIRPLAIFGLALFAVVTPYLLKNLFLTGNPFYPFFFPGKFWDAARAYWYSRPGTGLRPIEFLFAPWDATIWGVEGLQLVGHVSYTASLGPLLLMLTPLVALGWRERSHETRRHVVGILIVCVIAYGVWLAQLSVSGLLVQSRLLFPVLPLVAVVAAAGFDALSSVNTPHFRPQFVMGALIGLALAMTAVDYGMLFIQNSPIPVTVGLQAQSDYLYSRLGAYEAAMDKLNALPPGSKVMFLWEPRSYYCSAQIACEPDALLDRWWHLRQLGGTAESIAAEWKSAGVTHVLIYEAGRKPIEAAEFDPLTRTDWAELQRLRSERLLLVEDLVGVYQLYELR